MANRPSLNLTQGISNSFNENGFSIENIVGFNRIPWRLTGYLLHSRCSNTRTLDEHLKGKPASEVGSASATDGWLQRHRYTTWQAADAEPFESNSSLERNLLSISKLFFLSSEICFYCTSVLPLPGTADGFIPRLIFMLFWQLWIPSALISREF